MAQYLRVTDVSNYYHIMSRGVNKQKIFSDRWDYVNFIKLLRTYSKKQHVEILCYCLMPNHFHILLYDPYNNKANFMRCVKQIYSASYNKKYNRIGHLFNSRYKDKPIMDDKYLFIVFRYILLNSEKAGISNYKNYEWNSYSEMFSEKSFLSIDLIKELFGEISHIQQFIEITKEDYLSYSDDPIHDYKIKEKLKSNFGISDISIISKFNFDTQHKIVQFLKNEGLTYKKISELTNISVHILYKHHNE